MTKGNAMTIRFAESSDRQFWFTLDAHFSDNEFDKKVRDKQAYVLLDGEKPIGLLRFNLFWDNVPFCTMLYVDFEYHGRGGGRMLMERWEKDMKSQGYGMVMTSTQVDEDAQHFYRKLGYIDSGGLVLNIKGYEQPMEMFLTKSLA